MPERQRPEVPFLKCATVGIDGTGKSTSLDIAANELTSLGVNRIAFLGRKPFSCIEGRRKNHLAFLSVLDYLHEVADKTENKTLVLYTNLAHIYTQGRLVEPYMAKRIEPELMLSPRDYLVDSTVYAGVYWQELAVKGIAECERKARSISTMQPRDLLFFLTAPTDVAMERIQKRLQEHSFDRNTHNRPKWAHMHEKNAELLEKLRLRYYPVLNYFSREYGIEVHEVDTLQFNENEAAGYISKTVFERLRDPSSFRSGEWIIPKPDNQ
jgi:thymidylate kinase